MDERAYYQLRKGYREPKTVDEYEYFIKQLYRQLKKAYTVDEAKAIIEKDKQGFGGSKGGSFK